MEIFTYQDLKKFVNELNKEQLTMPVRWWGDETGGEIAKAIILKEDYVNESGEGVEPISAYANDPEYDVDELEVVLKKGTPIILDNV